MYIKKVRNGFYTSLDNKYSVLKLDRLYLITIAKECRVIAYGITLSEAREIIKALSTLQKYQDKMKGEKWL